MPSMASKNEPNSDHMVIAEERLYRAGQHLARTRNWYKKRSYSKSLREAMISIELSLELVCLLLGFDYEQKFPGRGWLGKLVEAIPPETVDSETARRYKRFAGELFHDVEMELDRIKQST